MTLLMIDASKIQISASPQLQNTEPNNSTNISKDEPAQPGNSGSLSRFSLLGQSDRLAKHAVKQKPLLGEICMSGEFTVWYAAPNTGKTLIALNLVFDAISRKRIDPDKVFYLNFDDSSGGLAAKAEIADDYRFHMLTQGHHGFTAAELLPAMQEMVRTGDAENTLVVLDTTKKFTDLMDKKRVSQFSEGMRQYILGGGTVLGLAHTNKRPGPDGKPIYAGTSDLVDDADSAYTITETSTDAASAERVVEFRCFKRRAGGVDGARYAYSVEDGLTYVQRVSSVRLVDPADDPRFGGGAPLPSDAYIVAYAQECLRWRPMAKMVFRDALKGLARISQRKAVEVIEKYTGDDPATAEWYFVVRERGQKLYHSHRPLVIEGEAASDS